MNWAVARSAAILATPAGGADEIVAGFGCGLRGGLGWRRGAVEDRPRAQSTADEQQEAERDRERADPGGAEG